MRETHDRNSDKDSCSCSRSFHKFQVGVVVASEPKRLFLPSMRTGVAPFLAFLLFLLAFADCARDFFMRSSDGAGGHHPFMDNAFILHELEKFASNEAPSSEGVASSNLCHPCLEISRKAQRILSDPTLSDQIDDLAGVFCRMAPFDLEGKCMEMMGTFKHRAITFLQEEVLEEKFCNGTGFCPERARASPFSNISRAELRSAMEHLNEMLTKMQKGLPMEAATRFLNSRSFLMNKKKIPLELGSNATCSLCLSVLDRMRNELGDPDKQLKIITALLKACETEVFVNQCKKWVFAYGPMAISSVQKFVNLDLCHVVHICEDPKNQTTTGYHASAW